MCQQGVAIQLVTDNPTLANNDPKYTALIIAMLVCGTVHAALAFSGGMFNPMLASVLVGGCKGHDMMEHVAIYWLGSTMGAILAEKIYFPYLRGKVYPALFPAHKKSD